jgi:nucleotide-binding universal stress UspA family protein
MKRNDRAEDLIPYVEKVARAGMRVVFMVPYPVDGFRGSYEEFGLKAIEEGKKLVSYYAWDANLQKAKDRISPALKVLPSKGIEVAVDLYAGSVRSAVRDYAAKGDVHLIVTRAGIGQRIAGFLSGSTSLFDLFKRSAVSPVLLIHPGVAA